MKTYRNKLEEADTYLPHDPYMSYDKNKKDPNKDTPKIDNNGYYASVPKDERYYTSKTFEGLRRFIVETSKLNKAEGTPIKDSLVKLIEQKGKGEYVYHSIVGITDTYLLKKNAITPSKETAVEFSNNAKNIDTSVDPDALEEAESYVDVDLSKYPKIMNAYDLRFFLVFSDDDSKCMTISELVKSIVNLSRKLCLLEGYSVDSLLKYSIDNFKQGSQEYDLFASITDEALRNIVINRYMMLLHTPVRLCKPDGSGKCGGQLYFGIEQGRGCLFFGKALGGKDSGLAVFHNNIDDILGSIETNTQPEVPAQAAAQAKEIADNKVSSPDVKAAQTVEATPEVMQGQNVDSNPNAEGTSEGLPEPED